MLSDPFCVVARVSIVSFHVGCHRLIVLRLIVLLTSLGPQQTMGLEYDKDRRLVRRAHTCLVTIRVGDCVLPVYLRRCCMHARARLITRGCTLRGKTVNDFQWNPTAGLGRVGDVGPSTPKKNKPKGHGHTAKVARRRIVPPKGTFSLAAKPMACPECERWFKNESGMETHRHLAHGTAAVVGDLIRCPECGVLVKERRMTSHRQRSHGMQ